MIDMNRLLDALRQQESGGDPNAVSSAGALGPYQIEPPTAAKPGFGVPSIPLGMLNNENASRAFAKNYLQAQLNRNGGNQDAALAAYNAGPGRAGAFERSGNMDSLPAETQDYIKKVDGYYNNGVPSAPDKTPARQRFDNIVNLFNPVSTADAAEAPASGTVTDATGPRPTSPRPMTPADVTAPGSDQPEDMSGVYHPGGEQLPGMSGGFAQTDPQQQDTPPQQPERLAPPGATASPAAPSPAAPVGNGQLGGLDWEGTIGPAMLAMGAGLASGSTQGWGAGLGAGFKGAQRVMENKKASDAALAPKLLAYRALYAQHLKENGGDAAAASNQAITDIYAPGTQDKWKPYKTGTDSNGNDTYKLVSDNGDVKEIPGASGTTSKDDAVDESGAPLVGQPYIDYMQKNHPDDARTQLSISNYDSDPKNLSLRKNRREIQLNGAMRMNQDFEPTNYNNIYTTRKNFLGGGAASVALGSGDQLVHHIGTMLQKFDAMNAVGGGPMHSSTLNPAVAPYNLAREKWLGLAGSKELTGAGSPVEGVSNEMAKLTHGVGAVPLQDVANWKQGINTHLTPEQQLESAKSLLTLAGGAFKRYKDVWERSVGPAYAAQHPFSSIFKLDAESRAVISKVGLTPDDFGLADEPAPDAAPASPASDGWIDHGNGVREKVQ